MIAIFLIAFVGVSAQEKNRIRLLDASNGLPISEATYSYGNQSGISDQEGSVLFTYEKDHGLDFSHVSYGEWTLEDSEVLEALETGIVFRQNRSVNLYPVTVIALRKGVSQAETIGLDYSDRMSHDGGILLSQSPAIGGIRKSASYGFDPVLRGFKYDQLNVVLDGAQGATAACPNRMDPPTSQMAPNMMNRIEVLKGPHALRYGTGFGGTVNFIPAPLRFSESRKFYGRASGGFESNGEIFRTEALAGLSHKKYDFGIFGSWSDGKDYTDGNGETVQADFSRLSIGASLGLKLSERQQLKMTATNNVARDVDFAALPMDLRDDDTWMFNLRHDIRILQSSLQSWSTSLYGSFVDHRMDNLLKSLDPRMVNAETTAQTSNYGGRTEGNWNFKGAELFAGADLRLEEADGVRTRSFLMGPNAGKTVYDNVWQDARISKIGAFAEVHLNRSSMQWVFSGRLEFNQAEALDPDPNFAETYPETSSQQVNPSFSMGGIKKLGHNIALGFWLGRAQRSGSLTERYINYFPVGVDPYEIVGNPVLDPEINYQSDITLKWSTANTALDLDLFLAYLEDYITSVIDTNLSPRMPTSPGVRQVQNAGAGLKTGFEINWIQKLVGGLKHQLGVAYTYGQDLDSGNPLPEIAPLDFRYRLFGTFVKNRLKPEILLRHVMEQTRVSDEFGESDTPAFTLIDIKVGYGILNWLAMEAGIRNLFDEAYYEHLNRSVKGTNVPIHAPGRSFYISLNVDLL